MFHSVRNVSVERSLDWFDVVAPDSGGFASTWSPNSGSSMGDYA